jgi:hypothetical protein
MSTHVTKEPVEVVVSEREIMSIRCDGPGCDWSVEIARLSPIGWAYLPTRFEVKMGDGRQWSAEWTKHFCGAVCLEQWAHLEARRLASFSDPNMRAEA